MGSDGYIEDISDKNVLKLFLGTNDIEQINIISQWFNNTNMSLWRLNSKPKQVEERVARFNAYSSRLDLDADRLLGDEYPTFRVLKAD